MMHQAVERIQQFIKHLDPDAKTALAQISLVRTFPKGHLMLRQHEICSRSFHLHQGIARKFYRHDDKEITTELYFEDDLAHSFESYALQQPSKEYIEALTEVTATVIHYHDFQQVKSLYPALQTLDLMVVEYYGIWLEERLFQLRTQSATERYLEILRQQPHIIQKLPLTIIASYLGGDFRNLEPYSC